MIFTKILNVSNFSFPSVNFEDFLIIFLKHFNSYDQTTCSINAGVKDLGLGHDNWILGSVSSTYRIEVKTAVLYICFFYYFEIFIIFICWLLAQVDFGKVLSMYLLLSIWKVMTYFLDFKMISPLMSKHSHKANYLTLNSMLIKWTKLTTKHSRFLISQIWAINHLNTCISSLIIFYCFYQHNNPKDFEFLMAARLLSNFQ